MQVHTTDFTYVIMSDTRHKANNIIIPINYLDYNFIDNLKYLLCKEPFVLFSWFEKSKESFLLTLLTLLIFFGTSYQN